MSKLTALVMIVLLTVSTPVLMLESAAGLTKPSVPEFTVQFVDCSYYVPVTYGIDPFTGKNITTGGGYQVDNRTLVFTIKNQPFTPYTNKDGNLIWLYYHVKAKGHFGKYWEELGGFINSSSSEYTIGDYTVGKRAGIDSILEQVTVGDTLDFQVEAQIGCYTRHYLDMYRYEYVFTDVGESSGWSSTQTITIGENTPTTSAEPIESTPEQTASDQLVTQNKVLFGLDWKDIAVALLVVVVAVLVLALVLSRIKKR